MWILRRYRLVRSSKLESLELSTMQTAAQSAVPATKKPCYGHTKTHTDSHEQRQATACGVSFFCIFMYMLRTIPDYCAGFEWITLLVFMVYA